MQANKRSEAKCMAEKDFIREDKSENIRGDEKAH